DGYWLLRLSSQPSTVDSSASRFLNGRRARAHIHLSGRIELLQSIRPTPPDEYSLADIDVDVVRVDLVPRTIFIDVLEQMLPWQFLDITHDLGHPSVLKLQPPFLVRFTSKRKAEAGAVNFHMSCRLSKKRP